MNANAIVERGLDLLFITLKDQLVPMTVRDADYDYDPVEGDVVVSNATTQTPQVILSEYTNDEIDGTQVQKGDYKAYVRKEDLTTDVIRAGIVVDIGVKSYEVKVARTDLFAKYWLLQLRSTNHD